MNSSYASHKVQLVGCFLKSFFVQLRRLWSEGQYIPGIPPDEIPDLNSCLLYQQLQVINCCVSRKRRNILATEQLNSVERLANSNLKISDLDTSPGSRVLYAKLTTGELVLRLGVNKLSDLQMLETGEPIYTAVIQVCTIREIANTVPTVDFVPAFYVYCFILIMCSLMV